MCAQLYIQKNAQPDTWVMSGAPTATTVYLSLPATINYSNDPSHSDTLPANTLAVLPDATTVLDRTSDVYVPYTVKGSGVLSIIKESLLPTLTSDYAPLARVELHGIKPYQPEPYLAAGGLGNQQPTTFTQVSDTVARALALWNGTSNNSPPSSWQTSGFDDSAWDRAALATAESSPYISGTHMIWAAASRTVLAANDCLVRHHVTLPAGTITAASLEICVDTVLVALYINGTAFGSTPHTYPGDVGTDHQIYSVPLGALVAGGSNVLALWAENDVDTSSSPPQGGNISYKLTITYAGSGATVATSGTPAEGDLLYYHNGQWTDLAIGTSGQELTVVSGHPAWATPPAGYSDPLSTKGDLLTRSSSATVRLGVGSDGQVLTADSAQTDGIKWATPAAGSVTSVGVSVPAPLSVSPATITSSGSFAITWTGGQSANQVLATPNGSSGAVALRALVGNDIPVDASTIVSSGGTIKGNYQAGSGVSISGNTISATGSGGTVTSVALSLPGLFSVSGSPVTGSGTLSASLVSQSQGTVFAAPSGSSGTPSFRALVGSDLPPTQGSGGNVHAHGKFL